MNIWRPTGKLPSAAIEACIASQMQAILWGLNWRVYIPTSDLEGVDWLAYDPLGGYKRVQQKTCFTIDKKYIGKELWIAFPLPVEKKAPNSFGFFLAPHDGLNSLMSYAEEAGHLKTPSWMTSNIYTHVSWRPNQRLASWLVAHHYLIAATSQ